MTQIKKTDYGTVVPKDEEKSILLWLLFSLQVFYENEECERRATRAKAKNKVGKTKSE